MIRPLAGFLCCLAVTLAAPDLAGQRHRSGVAFAGKEASAVQNKRVPFKSFDAPMNSDFTGKSFEMKSWDKHFSPWGSKRAAIGGGDGERKLFDTETIEFPEREFELARWNQQLAELEREARISTGEDPGLGTADAARGFDGRRTYDSQLQEAEGLDERGEKLSLRDVNRYMFRRNRPDTPPPVTPAGEG